MSETPPKISVVIYNRDTGIYAGRMLKALHKDRYPNLELIVIDDGSKDDSAEQIKHAVLENEIKNAHLYQLPKHQGKPTTYNLALEKLTGDYVIFTDAQDEIDQNFILALSTSLMNGASTLALTGVYDNSKRQKTARFCTLTKNRKPDETFRAYLTRLKKFDERLAPVYNKIFDVKIIREKDLKFSTAKDFDRKFVHDYLKAADVEKIVTINKPLYTYNPR